MNNLKDAAAKVGGAATEAAVPRLSNDEQYEDFVAQIEAQLSGFRASEEPPHEFARRLVGQLETWATKRTKSKKPITARANREPS